MDPGKLRRLILCWYSLHHRRLPWRAPPGELADPYLVLVSEVMLQQTQVATVLDYFGRFVERFPTVQALAAADEQHVLAVWQGLGYYRRARSLHRAARAIVVEHGGRIPRAAGPLMSLPGVGRYTAGAIGSIAFGEPVPVVDGNVSRVLSRLGGQRRAADDPVAVKRHWQEMSRLVRLPRGRYRPGDVNQAVMELGAVVCLPMAPRCSACPVRSMCAGYASGRPQVLGLKSRRRPPASATHQVLAIHRHGRWLLERRPDTGLWAGMWQLPTWEVTDGEAGALAARARQRLGISVGAIRPAGSFIHITTHRRIRFEVHVAPTRNGRLRRGAGLWRKLDDLDDLPLSRAQKKAMALIDAQPDPTDSPLS